MPKTIFFFTWSIEESILVRYYLKNGKENLLLNGNLSKIQFIILEQKKKKKINMVTTIVFTAVIANEGFPDFRIPENFHIEFSN